jgi:hypothetical protein
MPFDFLLEDINSNLSQKTIGTDKGLAKIGDGIVNLTYSIAKSIYLTKNSSNNSVIRTGLKVSKTILSNALKNAKMRKFAKNRADAHDIADTAEALVAYVWISNNMTLKEIIDVLASNLSGDLLNRKEEITSATEAFTALLKKMQQFLPGK